MQEDGIQAEIEIESEDEGLRVGRRQTMYEETAHDTWPLSFRVPRRAAIALREKYEELKSENLLWPGCKNFGQWLCGHFRETNSECSQWWQDLPWDQPLAVVDDQEAEG